MSRHVHDFVTCGCGNVSVDGGLDYAKRIWPEGDPEDWFNELSEYVDEEGTERKPGVEKARSVPPKALNMIDEVVPLAEMMASYERWATEEDFQDPRRTQVKEAIEAVLKINAKGSPHVYDLQQVALCALRAIRL